MQEAEPFTGSENLSPLESARAQKLGFSHGFRGIKRIPLDQNEDFELGLDIVMNPSLNLETPQKLLFSDRFIGIKRICIDRNEDSKSRMIRSHSNNGLGLHLDLDLDLDLTSEGRSIEMKGTEHESFANLLKFYFMFRSAEFASDTDASKPCLMHRRSGEYFPVKPDFSLQCSSLVVDSNLESSMKILDTEPQCNGSRRFDYVMKSQCGGSTRFDSMIESNQNQYLSDLYQNVDNSSLGLDNNQQIPRIFDNVRISSQTQNPTDLNRDVDGQDVAVKSYYDGARSFDHVKSSQTQSPLRDLYEEGKATIEGFSMDSPCGLSRRFDYVKKSSSDENSIQDLNREEVTMVEGLDMESQFGEVRRFDYVTKSNQLSNSSQNVSNEEVATVKVSDRELQCDGSRVLDFVQMTSQVQNQDPDVDNGLVMESQTCKPWRFDYVNKLSQACNPPDVYRDLDIEGVKMLEGLSIESGSSWSRILGYAKNSSQEQNSSKEGSTSNRNYVLPVFTDDALSGATSICRKFCKRCCWGQESLIHSRKCFDDNLWTYVKGSCDRYAKGNLGLCGLHGALLEDRRVHGSATFERVGSVMGEAFELIDKKENFLSSFKAGQHCDGGNDRSDHNDCDEMIAGSFKGGQHCEGGNDGNDHNDCDDMIAGDECMFESNSPMIFSGEQDDIVQEDTQLSSKVTIFSSDLGVPYQMLAFDTSSSPGVSLKQEGIPRVGSVLKSRISSGNILGPSAMQRHASVRKRSDSGLKHKANLEEDDNIFDMSSLDLPDERVHGGNIMSLLGET